MQNDSNFNPFQSQPLTAAQPTAPASQFNPINSAAPTTAATPFNPLTAQPTTQATQAPLTPQHVFQPVQPQPTQQFQSAAPTAPASQFNPINSATPTTAASPFNPLTAQPAAPAAAASLQPITPAQPTTSATSGYTGAGFAAIDPSVLAPNTPANNANGTTSTSAFSQLTTQAGNIIADRPTLPSQQFGGSQVPQSRLPHYVTTVATPPNSFKNILCEALIPVSTSGYCTSRRTYILAATVQVVVVTLLMILCVVLAASGMGLLDLLVFPFAIIYFVVSLFMLMRRRLCDAGKPTWLRFLVFTPAAPVVCFIANFAPSIQWQDNVPRYLSFFNKK